MIIEKLIFLYHGGKIPQTNVQSNISPLTGIIVIVVLAIMGLLLWSYFTKKKY